VIISFWNLGEGSGCTQKNNFSNSYCVKETKHVAIYSNPNKT
jgi:hypothetical protein